MPTPLDWVRKLYAKIIEQRRHAQLYDKYYSGEHRLEIIEQDFREVFGTKAGSAITAVLEPARVNISRVAIEALTERMIIDGFTVGADDDQAGADAARRIWMDNDLDEMSGVAHVEAAVKGAAFTLVWPDSDGDPVVSIEDVEQTAIARMSVPPYDVIAALKVWTDEWTADEMADLYLPDKVWRWKRNRRAPSSSSLLIVPSFVTSVSTSDWLPQAFDNDAETIDNPFGRPPVTELANRARLLRPPRSDLVDVAPLHDASDKILGDLIIAASFGAVPVRYATGLKILADEKGKPVDEKGNPVTPIEVRSDRFLTSPDAASRFGTLDGSNLEGFVKASNEVMARFRTVTRVPYHYIDMGGTSGVAGETLVAFEGPLNRRKAGTCLRVGSGWRKTIALCLEAGKSEFAGKPVATRWADTESKSLAQQADAFTKLVKSGTPFEVAAEKVLGWPRETIRRALKLREQEQLSADAALAAVQRDASAGGPVDTVPAVAT